MAIGAPAGPDGESGFTLIEVLCAAALIAAVMLFSTVYFVQATSTARRQGDQQAAAQLAADAMEWLRSLPPSALATGRSAAAAAGQWSGATAGSALATVLRQAVPAADPDATVAGSAGVPTALLPVEPTQVTLHGLTFNKVWYVGECWLNGAGLCVASSSGANPTRLFQVVVAISWPARDCPGDRCVYLASTLVNPHLGPPLIVPPPAGGPRPPLAVWANGADADGFSVTGSAIAVNGGVHSNGGIAFTASVLSISPLLEYVTTFKNSGSVMSAPGPSRVAPSIPAHRDVASYSPGSAAALAAGSGYKVMPCASGTWTYSAADVGAATVIYVPCNVSLSRDAIVLNALLVAEGTIAVTGSDLVIGDKNREYAMGLVSNSTADPAISITGSAVSIYGNVQALQGGVRITGSAAALKCGVMGDTVTVVGDAITIKIDSGCLP